MKMSKQPKANWSSRELQAVGEFAKRTLPNIRRIQSITNQQIRIVMNEPDNSSVFIVHSREDILWRLQRMGLIIAAAIDKKCFKD